MKNKFIRIVDGFPDVIYSIDKDFNLVVANRAASEFARKRIKNIIGKKCYKALYKRDKICKNCPAEISLKTNKAYFTVFKTPKKYYEIYSYVIGEKEVILSYKDITREIKYEKEYLRYYNLIKEIFDSLNDFVVMINNQGRAAAVNAAFLKIFQNEYNSVINKNYKELFPENIARGIKRNLKEGADFEAAYNGKIYAMAVIKIPAGGSFIIRGTDITLIKEHENKMAQNEKMRAVAELSAGVAHEFNNILTSILGYAQIMKRDGKYNGRAADTIIRSSFRAKKLIENLLFFSKPREFKLQKINIKEVIEKTIVIIKQELKGGISVKTVFTHKSKILLNFNSMLQIFVNLILNSIQAGADKIKIITEEDAENLKITVSDNGEGINDEIKDKIFEPFFTTKKTPRGGLTAKGGSGLGLSVVYGIIKNHKGTIKVEDNHPRGAQFAVLLKR